jgi:hypothetical protein
VHAAARMRAVNLNIVQDRLGSRSVRDFFGLSQ